MPELPDLEVYKDNVYSLLTSKRVVDVTVFNVRKLTTPQAIWNEALQGETLTGIRRVGKELFFDFTNDKYFSAHLMLNGTMTVLKHGEGIAKVPYKLFAVAFEEETLVFGDRGGLCTIKYLPKVNSVPDAFEERFTLAYFRKVAARKGTANIKALLIDQGVVKGIGNAYADEILYDARISPYSLVGKLPDEALERLYASIGKVLHEAIDSIRQIDPEIISGEIRDFLQVHTKARKQTESGAEIRVDRVVSKITYYTDEQVLYK